MQQANVQPLLTCPDCRGPFHPDEISSFNTVTCSICNTRMEAYIFPELRKRMMEAHTEQVSATGTEASCFFHQDKKAVTHCDSCGRFLCNLCDIELGKRRLCPLCAASGKKKGKLKALQNKAMLYDKVALLLSVYPLLLIFTAYFTIFTAPIALFVVLRFWKKQKTVVPRSKARFIVAGIVSVLEIILWVVFISFIVIASKSSGES